MDILDILLKPPQPLMGLFYKYVAGQPQMQQQMMQKQEQTQHQPTAQHTDGEFCQLTYRNL